MIRVARVREVDLPRRAYSGEAGVDFFLPKIDEAFVRDFAALPANAGLPPLQPGSGSLCLPPMSQALIPSGIVCEIPEGTGFFQFDKSSVSTVEGPVVVLARLVDASYQGELHLSVFNLRSAKNVFFEVGKAISQFVLLPVLLDAVEEVLATEVFTRTSPRGTRGFGSTAS